MASTEPKDERPSYGDVGEADDRKTPHEISWDAF